MDRLSGIFILYTQIRTIFLEGFIVELKAIIRDKSIGNPESSNNVLPDEPFDIYIPDVSQRLSFDLLGEIVCTN